VIFKKYSPMGELQAFAAQICESMSRNTGHIAAVSDRDSIIAVHGAAKRELLEKRCTPELEEMMEQRRTYRWTEGERRLPVSEAAERYQVGVAVPILSEGDLIGSVLLLLEEKDAPLGEGALQLAQTVAGFLGRQMES